MANLKSMYESLAEQIQKEIDEYKAETDRMTAILNAVGIDVDGSDGIIDPQLVETLAKAADVLGVVDVDPVNMSLAVMDMESTISDLEKEISDSKRRIEKNKQMHAEITQQNERISKTSKKLIANEERYTQELNKANKSTLFHSKKKSQYLSNIESTKKALASLGYDESISHECITELGAEVRELEEKLKVLQLKLQSYKDLPPSIPEAQVKLEEKKAELKRIENELAEKLGNVAVSDMA